MKLSEIRNRMFNLSDLKGLIKENTFDEAGRGRAGLDWAGYFKDNPDRLNQSFLEAMGLPTPPEEPITIDQIGDSEMRKYFGDEVVSKILSDPINFIHKKGTRNTYDIRKSNYKSLFGTQKTGGTLLKQFFIENGGDKIDNTPILRFEQNQESTNNELNRDVLTYFYTIKNLAERAVEYAKENNFKDFDKSGIIIGDVKNPFSMFLYFYFDMYVTGQGVFKKQNNFDANIPEEFKPYIERVNQEVKIKGAKNGTENNTVSYDDSDSVPAFIQSYILEPIGLRYTSELYEYSDVLYEKLFARREGIERLKSILKEIPNGKLSFKNAGGRDGRMAGTVGCVVYCALAIMSASDSSQKNLIESIRSSMSGEDFERFRSAAYLARYEMKTNQLVQDDFKNKMIKCFGFSYPDEAFDPLMFIDYAIISNGLKKWVEIDDISFLTKSVLNVSANPDAENTEMCPAEKIFLSARNIKKLLTETNYDKYGAGPGKTQMTLGLLLGSAVDGLAFWQRTNPTSVIPKPQGALKTMYDIEKRKTPNEELSFWRLLSKDNSIKDKTQTEIYYWLINHTDPSIGWTYEYNRNEKIDNDLGQKSIDIMAKTPSNTFCFEYQGEQHYRPLTVTYEDYKKFPIYDKMREYILEGCGFKKKVVGNTTYFFGPENSDDEKMYEIKERILDAYREFYEELPGAGDFIRPTDTRVQSRQLAEARSFVPQVNRKKMSDIEVIMYFQKVMSKSPNDSEIFENPPIEGLISYVGSPRRFLDEVKTAQDMSRDVIKRNIIRQKEKEGWVMSYVIPKNITSDEKKYTEELAGSKDNVFTWDKPGRNKLMDFLSLMDLLKKEDVPETINESKTLFQEIIKDYLFGGTR